MDKVNELCNFLCDKGMSQNSYLEIADWQELHHSYDMLSYCKKIYDLFSYIGLTNEQIEMFIIHNKKEVRKQTYMPIKLKKQKAQSVLSAFCFYSTNL